MLEQLGVVGDQLLHHVIQRPVVFQPHVLPARVGLCILVIVLSNGGRGLLRRRLRQVRLGDLSIRQALALVSAQAA